MFLDPLSVTGGDPDHSLDERRFVTVGVVAMYIGTTSSGSSALAPRRGQKCSMRKVKTVAADELRSEYKRSDFGPLVRGKYIERLRTSSNVVMIAPEVADLFPSEAAVNAALRPLAEIARRAGSRRARSR